MDGKWVNPKVKKKNTGKKLGQKIKTKKSSYIYLWIIIDNSDFYLGFLSFEL